MQHERDPDKAVACEVDARINHAAISLATDHRTLQLHRIRNIHFANLRQKHRTIELLRHVCDCGSGREIRDDWSLLASQHEKRREHERVVFADRFALLRDDRQSIRVHVLRESDISLMLFDCATEIAEVLR